MAVGRYPNTFVRVLVWDLTSVADFDQVETEFFVVDPQYKLVAGVGIALAWVASLVLLFDLS